MTPNPEMMVLAQNDLELKKSCQNNADLAIPDGWGVKVGKPGNRPKGVRSSTSG